MKTWFITGGSTGLGRAIAEQAFERGDVVITAAIDPENMQDYPERFGARADVKYLDVSDQGMVEKVFNEAVAAHGNIDVVVNCAGFVHFGALEDTTEAQARAEMNVNFFGTLFVSQLAAKHMRENKSGTIIQISSLAGVDTIAGNALYGASKWAVEGMSEALRHEMAPFGVRVILIEPGKINTGIEKRAKLSNIREEYREILAGQNERWGKGDTSGNDGDPVNCAKVIMKLVDAKNPPIRLPLTTFAWDISFDVAKARLEELEAWKDYCVLADYGAEGFDALP